MALLATSVCSRVESGQSWHRLFDRLLVGPVLGQGLVPLHDVAWHGDGMGARGPACLVCICVCGWA